MSAIRETSASQTQTGEIVALGFVVSQQGIPLGLRHFETIICKARIAGEDAY